jgi:hypothetical protein
MEIEQAGKNDLNGAASATTRLSDITKLAASIPKTES